MTSLSDMVDEIMGSAGGSRGGVVLWMLELEGSVVECCSIEVQSDDVDDEVGGGVGGMTLSATDRDRTDWKARLKRESTGWRVGCQLLGSVSRGQVKSSPQGSDPSSLPSPPGVTDEALDVTMNLERLLTGGGDSGKRGNAEARGQGSVPGEMDGDRSSDSGRLLLAKIYGVGDTALALAGCERDADIHSLAALTLKNRAICARVLAGDTEVWIRGVRPALSTRKSMDYNGVLTPNVELCLARAVHLGSA